MALAADLARPFEAIGPINTLPVKASATIYRGSAVGLSSGYARALNAGDPFVGFADAKVVETTAVDGAKNVNVITHGLVQINLTGVAITDVGNAVYMSDDGTFTQTKGSNSFVGNVYRYVGTNTCVISFIASGVAYGAVAAGSALPSAQILVGNGSNVAAAVAMSGDVTINNSGVTAIGNGKVTETMLESATLSKILSYAKSFVTSHVLSSAH